MTDILINHGVDIDIVTGEPLDHRPEDHARDKARFDKTVLNSFDLTAELHQSDILKIIVNQYVQILTELAQKDVRCQVLENLVRTLGYNTDLAPRLAEERLTRTMTPSLKRIYQEKKAAPQGIPADINPARKGHPETRR